MAFMIHPKHGATHTQDVAGHEAQGWKVSTYEEWLASKTFTDQGGEQAKTKRGGRKAADQGGEQ